MNKLIYEEFHSVKHEVRKRKEGGKYLFVELFRNCMYNVYIIPVQMGCFTK